MYAHVKKPQCFFADAMLGTLARWLRTLGYDVAYERAIEDSDLVERAVSESRVVLTRDTLLVKRRALRGRYLFIEGQCLSRQLKEVLKRFPPPASFEEGFLSRCLRCNEALIGLEKETLKNMVPDYVLSTENLFTKCRLCARIYWPGTHRARMIEELQRLVGDIVKIK